MSNVNRLKDILSRSKAVMQATEQSYGTTTTNTQNNNYGSEEKEMPNLTENYIKKNQRGSSSSVAPVNGRYRNLEKSKMPDVIKKAMIDNPIDIPENPYHTFELDDVSDLLDTGNHQEYKHEEKIKNKPLTENTSLNLNDTVIRKIVKEEMENVVRSVIEEYFEKSLVTEDIQIRVGGTTFSGKLKPLPNKRK